MLVDREDGTGDGFNGVLSAAEEKADGQVITDIGTSAGKEISVCPPGHTTTMACPGGSTGISDCELVSCELVTTRPTTTMTTTTSGTPENVNQCRTGRNKCSENAICKDMPDELNENNETVGKSVFFIIINDIYMSWTSEILFKPCTTVDARLDSRVMDSIAKLLNKNHAEMTLELNFKRLKSKILKILSALLVIMS